MAKKQISREGFEKLQEEYTRLVTVRRAEVAQKLKEARSFGDLSENAEYDEAKNEQALLEAQIAHLEETISNAAMKKKVGDIFIVEAPVGEIRFEVIDISK